VLIRAVPGDVPALARRIAGIDGVAEVYSVSGDYDLIAIVRVREYDRIAEIVTEEIAQIQGIERTNTLTAFRVYSKQDLGAAWVRATKGAGNTTSDAVSSALRSESAGQTYVPNSCTSRRVGTKRVAQTWTAARDSMLFTMAYLKTRPSNKGESPASASIGVGRPPSKGPCDSTLSASNWLISAVRLRC